MQLLVLSNGHGEDAIALRIIEQLQCLPNVPKIVALPLVGTGHAYTHNNIPIIGPMQQMPSGGFIYMDGRQLWQDLRGGLLKLTWAQYQVIRQWSKAGGKILAVGDIVPLLLAWLSGAEYAFVGTAKSEYYLRDEDGWLPQTSFLERWLGAVYAPWDRWLMSRPRCKAVFPRDSLTTEVLKQWSIPVFDLGNPMMDGIKGRKEKETRGRGDAEKGKGEGFKVQNNVLTILLLPGSRMPEAQRNWQTILEAVQEVVATFYRESFSTRYAVMTQSVRFLAAIAPALPLASFESSLVDGGWLSQSLESTNLPLDAPDALIFEKNNATLILSKHENAFAEYSQAADLAIAMAGTATEQFVGLGKPVIIIPGKGPQFTYAFAEAQARLLGCSVILVKQPQQVAHTIQNLLQNPDRWHQINENGRRRMGESGAAARIANYLMEVIG